MKNSYKTLNPMRVFEEIASAAEEEENYMDDPKPIYADRHSYAQLSDKQAKSIGLGENFNFGEQVGYGFNLAQDGMVKLNPMTIMLKSITGSVGMIGFAIIAIVVVVLIIAILK